MKHIPWTKFDPADLQPCPTWMPNAVPCPVCKGHTSCIVDEDAYGEGKHFKYACSQCGGMCPIGWVQADSKNATCIHDFSSETKIGNCLYVRTCSKCGMAQEIDSSG